MRQIMFRRSDLIRSRVKELFIRPALDTGLERFSVKVRDVMRALDEEGAPAKSRTPMVCQVLLGNKILEENGINIESVDGPPSKQSNTVVVHYRIEQRGQGRTSQAPNVEAGKETAAEWAERVTSGIQGLLKEEITSFGGTQAFMKWVRSEDDEG